MVLRKMTGNTGAIGCGWGGYILCGETFSEQLSMTVWVILDHIKTVFAVAIKNYNCVSDLLLFHSCFSPTVEIHTS